MPEIKLEDAQKELQDLVKEKKAEIKVAEPKGAAPVTPPEIKKTKEELEAENKAKVIKDAEDKAKDDERILSLEDKDLDDKSKLRKSELIKFKEKKDEDARIKSMKENVQKRIDELTAKNKHLEHKSEEDKRELEKLRKEKEDLITKQRPPEVTKAEALRKAESERITKYLEEDKGKPRETRREMSKEEIEEWLLEDMAAANEWMTERGIRRASERAEDKGKADRDERVKTLIEKQNEAGKRVTAKHPELDVDGRARELKAEGKSDEETKRIIWEENSKFRTFMTIVNENPSRYMMSENGPELAMEEMEKRISNPSQSHELSKKVEDLTKKNEELTAELEKLQNSDVGINSTVPRSKETKEKLTEAENILTEVMRENGASEENIKSALEKMRKKKNG